MNRNEIKQKIKECLQKFDGVDSPDDMVSKTLFNIYGQEMNEICRLCESEFRKLLLVAVSKSGCECKDEWLVDVRLNVMKCKKCGQEF